MDDLRAIWVQPEQRKRLLGDLQRASVHVDVLADVLGQSDVDQFDLLCNLTFGAPLRSRAERATAFVNRESRFINRHSPQARKVVLALVEKYRVVGIDEVSDPRVFRLSPFLEMGQAPGVASHFGSASALRQSVNEIQQRIYAE